MRVLILHDALSADARPDELDTLVQVEAVDAALRSVGASVARGSVGADPDAAEEVVRAVRPDVVFNLVESLAGDGRPIHRVPRLLERLDVAFTGAGSRALRAASSKLLTKDVLAAAHIPTPAWRTLERLRAGAGLGGPGRWLVKSVWEHGSLGLEPEAVFEPGSPRELAERIERLQPGLGGEAFAERYVHGREFNVGLLAGPRGPQCLPLPEILFEGLPSDAPRIVGYRAKWAPESPEYESTPRRFASDPADAALHERLRELALATWRAFDLAGWARVDFRVGDDGVPQVIDVNANPCLSPDAGFAAALERAGLSYAQALERIVAAGLERAAAARSAARVPHPADQR